MHATGLQGAALVLLGKGTEDDDIVLGGFDHARGEREAQARVENDAQQRTAARQSAAVGEQGIVGDDRADADQNCIGGVTHLDARGGAQLRR